MSLEGISYCFFNSLYLCELSHFILICQSWTKEETDQLFDLCKRFDLRFVIIADRFPSNRTVEELKDRYYSGIIQLLIVFQFLKLI